jgi:hypothetical protein
MKWGSKVLAFILAAGILVLTLAADFRWHVLTDFRWH